jgi:hypothetical protein
MSEFEKYAKDIAYVLEAQSIRVDAPIRGTSLVGIEVPSTERATIHLDDKHLEKGTMSLPIGVDVYGKTIRKDLADIPDNVTRDLEIIPVKWIDQVLDIALVKPILEPKKSPSVKKKVAKTRSKQTHSGVRPH